MRIAVIGAGLIGREHARRVQDHPRLELSHIVDPALQPERHPFDPATRIAGALDDVLDEVDGTILATPNHLHAAGALAAVEAGVPVLVEKPIADTVEAAERIAAASESTGVPVLVGHHRRHSPLLATAIEAVAGGAIGKPVAITGSALFHKPEEYFETAPWRTRTGGGPILINLIHDIDNLRALCGEITRVQAVSSNQARGFDVEDTVAITLSFANGALGTFILSDAAASARSWEQTSRENPGYTTADDEDCYHIAGTRGSLSIPTMRMRTYAGEASWWEPFTVQDLRTDRQDPLDRQLDHFEQVLRDQVAPEVTAHDGLQSLRVVHAVLDSTGTGAPVDVPTGIPAPQNA